MRRFLYPAPRFTPGTPIDGLVTLADAALVHRSAPEGRPTVVYFHGNGSDISGLGCFADLVTGHGMGVALPEYPGYGPLSGVTPTEDGIMSAARASLDYLAECGVPADRLVVVGESLGSSPASRMAAEGRAAACVLVAPFTSIDAMYRRIVPFYPLAWVPDHHRTDLTAPNIAVPTLLIHGSRDITIPSAMSVALAERIDGASCQIIDARTHFNLWDAPSIAEELLVDFVNTHVP